MDMDSFAKSPIGRVFIRVLGAGMESRLRYRFFGPLNILKGAGMLPGQSVLEIGCGTGFFSLPAAHLIGEQGSLVSLDVVSESVELVAKKVQAAGLKNVRVVKGNAMDTGLEPGSFDTVLLFGVIPAPMLPLDKLLPELQRVLKINGTLAVWPPVPGYLPRAILQSGLYLLSSKRDGVYNFNRC